jgi:hypothetical protein
LRFRRKLKNSNRNLPINSNKKWIPKSMKAESNAI